MLHILEIVFNVVLELLEWLLVLAPGPNSRKAKHYEYRVDGSVFEKKIGKDGEEVKKITKRRYAGSSALMLT